MKRDSHCGAISATGLPCFVRTRDGARCPLHSDHKRVAPQSSSSIATLRCAGKTPQGAPCFIRVHREGDCCRHHRAPATRDQLIHEAKRLGEAVDRLTAAIKGLA